jgi:hypothetical protein
MRYAARDAELQRRIAAIATEGDTIGWRLDQLASVRKVRASQSLFQDLVKALLECSPEGVTYSEVDVMPSGAVTIRGQASSAGVPFLLPERLEAQPLLENVVVKDSAQTARSDGLVTDFRLECRLKRRAHR